MIIATVLEHIALCRAPACYRRWVPTVHHALSHHHCIPRNTLRYPIFRAHVYLFCLFAWNRQVICRPRAPTPSFLSWVCVGAACPLMRCALWTGKNLISIYSALVGGKERLLVGCDHLGAAAIIHHSSRRCTTPLHRRNGH